MLTTTATSMENPTKMNPASEPVAAAASETDEVNSNPESGGVAGTEVEVDRNGQHHPVAEFLYQLTKMLTDDNSEIIEWLDGRIKVHHPERLEAEVLHKYFRHSKFASFQRQLNYFGFRKIAGKGKMSPCSYVNDAATSDIRSLLLIKRKTNGSAARKAAMQQRAAALNLGNFPFSALAANPAAMAAAASLNPQALTSAMALLSDPTLRNGFLQQMASQQGQSQNTQLGLLALQQQQFQQQQQQQQTMSQGQNNIFGQNQSGGHTTETTPDHHQQALQHQQQLQQLQQRFSGRSQSDTNSSQPPAATAGGGGVTAPTASNPTPISATPSLEQLQANLSASLSNQFGSFAGSLGSLGSFGSLTQAAPAMGSASAALANVNNNATSTNRKAGDNPATAALQSMAAAGTSNEVPNAAPSSGGGNLFESALNLESLLQEYQGAAAQQEQERRKSIPLAGSFNGNSAASQVLLNRLPSSGTIFPSTTSLGNLGMNSSNRISSLLSLGSLVNSRDSLADLAAQLPSTSRVGSGFPPSSFNPMDAQHRFRN